MKYLASRDMKDGLAGRRYSFAVEPVVESAQGALTNPGLSQRICKGPAVMFKGKPTWQHDEIKVTV